MKRKLIAAETVGAYAAMTRLPKLLDRVERGERFVIARYGKPVAQLIPFEESDDASIAQILARVDRVRARLARQGVTLSGILEPGESVRDLARSGHRH
ncbi:MAG: type II toxin-antitoxin system prevent-host-death family antitoxin [Burkholderiales bacterium]|jgi:prevent-host-death family protein|nr:MAG: type II toxin-antitoxin system prevent-host-death family antitoxin [Burkholderiales bacterium]